MHTVKPIDKGAILAAADTGAVFTLEEHSVVGGLGGAVAEILLESDRRPAVFRRIGVNDRFTSKVGDQSYLRAHYGLDLEGALATVERALGRRALVGRAESA
jgi:transketolase